MNQAECAELLTVVTAYDRRTLGEVDVIAWHGALGDLHLAECKQAVIAHYKASTDWLMPANVRKLVVAVRQDLAMRSLPAGRDDLVPMPSWFRGLYEKSLAETRASGKYPKPGPMAKTVDQLAGDPS